MGADAAQCRKIKEVGDLMIGEPENEALWSLPPPLLDNKWRVERENEYV